MSKLIAVLEDGQTFSCLEGASIQSIENVQIEQENDLDSGIVPFGLPTLHLGEVKDSDTILKWFRIFFPNMTVSHDEEGQVLIHTGIVE